MKKSDYSNNVMYLWIAATVVVFNLIAIFGLDILLHDDPERYRSVIHGDFPEWVLRHATVWPYKEWIAWKIMAISPELMRGINVVFFMVPLSMCFYYIWYHKFGFTQISAFAASVLPNILPHQWQIPAGINMSYSLHGLLVAVISLIVGFQYLEKCTPRNYIRLLIAGFLFLLATQLMEQTLFLFPPFILAFIGYTKLNRKHVWLASLFSLAALSLYIRMTLSVRTKPADLSPEAVFERIDTYFQWALPIPQIESGYFVAIFFVIIAAGFLLSFRASGSSERHNQYTSHMTHTGFVSFTYVFLMCWSVLTIFAFIWMSPSFSPRYTHISAFGLNALFVLSLYHVVNRSVFRKLKLPVILIVSLVVFSGISRHVTLKENFDYKNKTNAIIVKHLSKQSIPEDSQIVIVGVRGVPGGWFRSTGFLMFALQRNDVSGLLGSVNSSSYYNFDNHFSEQRAPSARYNMTGLSIDKPTFFFRMNRGREELIPLDYALQWKGNTKTAPWTVIHSDTQTGELRPLVSGLGMGDYSTALQSLETRGIFQSDILWGGPPTARQSDRLERLELDPPLLRTGIYAAMEINPMTRSSHGQIISSSKEYQILEIADTITPLKENVNFDDRFQLVSSFSDEIPDRNGNVSNIGVTILWKSLVNQEMKSPLLVSTLLKGGEKKIVRYLAFVSPDSKITAGDIVVTCIQFPIAEFKKAERLGITLFTKPSPDWVSLNPIGENTDERGRRLLIELN